MSKIKELNEILFKELENLQEKPNYERNKAINETARTIINNFKVQVKIKELQSKGEVNIDWEIWN